MEAPWTCDAWGKAPVKTVGQAGQPGSGGDSWSRSGNFFFSQVLQLVDCGAAHTTPFKSELWEQPEIMK